MMNTLKKPFSCGLQEKMVQASASLLCCCTVSLNTSFSWISCYFPPWIALVSVLSSVSVSAGAVVAVAVFENVYL